MKLRRHSLADFRYSVDGSDPFITGHGTYTVRQPGKKIPAALKTEEGIRALLLKMFPKMTVDGGQRFRAGQWARVIQLHYKFHYSERMTAEEMGISPRTVNSIKTRIRRAVQGRRLDGSGCYWKKRRKK